MTNINPLDIVVSQLPIHNVDHLDDVSLWLQECGLSEYISVFKSAGYDDINLIKILNNDDLDAMGIDKPGTRRKILMYADQLKQIADNQIHLVEQHVSKPSKPKGNTRANPYRCTKCCEFKIRSLDGKAHECKPELVGHSWENCPTQNIRQHPEERQRRKQDHKANKGRARKRKGVSKSDTSPESESSPDSGNWEYAEYNMEQNYNQFQDQHIFDFDGPPLKRSKIDHQGNDIAQQVAEVSSVMENYISEEIAKQLGELSDSYSTDIPPPVAIENEDLKGDDSETEKEIGTPEQIDENLEKIEETDEEDKD